MIVYYENTLNHVYVVSDPKWKIIWRDYLWYLTRKLYFFLAATSMGDYLAAQMLKAENSR